MPQPVTLACVTPTLCDLFAVPRPKDNSAEAVALPVPHLPLKRGLVFAADAIGAMLVRDFVADFDRVRAFAPAEVAVQAVMPSVTPVNFATMFTGASPEVHGIQTYAKPVLTCDTLFDAFPRAGLKVALVAVRDASMDRIFRERPIDYFSETYDPQVAERVLQLLSDDRYDLIVAYQQEYDDTMHATVPRSPEALQAMQNHLRSFETLAAAARRRWQGVPHAIAFVSDHGTHIDPETGLGTHGSDMPDDLDVLHFWGIYGPA